MLWTVFLRVPNVLARSKIMTPNWKCRFKENIFNTCRLKIKVSGTVQRSVLSQIKEMVVAWRMHTHTKKNHLKARNHPHFVHSNMNVCKQTINSAYKTQITTYTVHIHLLMYTYLYSIIHNVYNESIHIYIKYILYI